MPGRKAAAGTEPSAAAVIRVRSGCLAGNGVAALGLWGGSGSLPSVSSWWSVGDHKRELRAPSSENRASSDWSKSNHR